VNAEPSGSLDSYLSGINRHGLAVGGYCPQGCNPETGQHGYTYDSRSRKIRTIDFPLKGAATAAYGINDTGVIVGGYCPNSPVCPQGAFSPAAHGFVDAKGVFTTLDFPSAQDTSAFAINDAGTIVGFYIINNTGPHAFLYQNGTFTNIDFPGSGDTVATAINNLGVVAGIFSNSTGVHGFIYFNGQFEQIDKPGATATQVTGINDRNELVGYWNPTIGIKNFKAIPVTPVVLP
jgi:probable HAF family extracellular repeat protein